jgi:hypothetical protein
MLAKGFQVRQKCFGRFVGIGFDRQRAEFYLVLQSLARAVNDWEEDFLRVDRVQYFFGTRQIMFAEMRIRQERPATRTE